jgi:hypothetical protein
VVECVEGTPALDLELERLVRSLIDDTHGHATGRLAPEQVRAEVVVAAVRQLG